MALPSPGSTAGEVESFLKSVMRAPGGFSSLGTSVPRVIEEASAVAAESWGVETGVEATGIAAALAGLSLGEVSVIIIVVVLALVVVLRILEAVMYKIGDLFPWGIGRGPWRSFVHGIFNPIDSLENWVAHEFVNALKILIHALWTLLHLAVLYVLSTIPLPAGGHEGSAIATLHSEYQDLYQKYNDLERQVQRLDDSIAGSAPAIPTVNPVNNQLHHLQTVVVDIAHNVGVLHSTMVALQESVSTDHKELVQLKQALVGVTATAFGVQELITTVETTVKTLEHEMGAVLPELNGAIATLTLLKPLEQLMYLGQPGINVLKKLEKKPCQCPRYPGLQSDKSEALAVYEFLTNG